jgi:hypothetical protein
MEFTMFPKPPSAVGFRFYFPAAQALTDQPCHLRAAPYLHPALALKIQLAAGSQERPDRMRKVRRDPHPLLRMPRERMLYCGSEFR